MHHHRAFRKRLWVFAALALAALSVVPFAVTAQDKAGRDVDEIKKSGELVLLTRYNQNSYFSYRGQEMGFEYELAHKYAEHLGVKLKVEVPREWGQLIPLLNEGKGDIVAANMTITLDRRKAIDFVEHIVTKQVLVQKKPKDYKKLAKDKLEKMMVRDPIELLKKEYAGKEIGVRKSASYFQNLVLLGENMGQELKVKPMPEEMETEEIIKLVQRGELPFTVADENIALIQKAYYDDLDVQTALSFKQRIGWGVRKSSPKLRGDIEAFLRDLKKKPDFNVIYAKYYSASRAVDRGKKMMASPGTISEFDKFFKQYSTAIDWDWRLLAAQAYQESQFNPKTQSWAGAQGLIQMMPATAKKYGASDPFDPEQNTKAATKYIKWLRDETGLKDIPMPERIKFMLASYNAGQGHIFDAMRLAEKWGKDKKVWKGVVEDATLKLGNKIYFQDPVVKYGYCRGEEPVNYVHEIMERYELYKKSVKQ